MLIEGVRVRPGTKMAPGVASDRDWLCGGRRTPHTNYMLDVEVGRYDRNIARALCIASAWAYSDIGTFAGMMDCKGWMRGNQTVKLQVTNAEFFLRTTAYLTQSSDKKLLILAFRGSELRDVTTWLSDASVRMDPFRSAGYVHGGFYRATLVLWPTLKVLLDHANRGGSICDAAMAVKSMTQRCTEEAPRGSAGGQPWADTGEAPPLEEARAPDALRVPRQPALLDEAQPLEEARAPDRPRLRVESPAGNGSSELKGLFITGHSMGGALAVLTAALIHATPELKLQPKLRAIYTFGQPMVGDEDFAHRFEKDIGNKLKRHVHGLDVVPRLPPRSAGRFTPLGEEYSSSEAGWVYRSRPVSQVYTFLGSTVLGLLHFLQQQLAGIPILRRIPFPFSWDHHGLQHYLRTSVEVPPGAELE